MTKEAMKLALDALKLAVMQNEHDMLMTREEIHECVVAHAALEEALAKQERGEPMGYQQLFNAIAYATKTPYEGAVEVSVAAFEKALGSKIYTTPQQRTWIGLTDGEIERDYYGRHDFVRAVELRIKEKNT